MSRILLVYVTTECRKRSTGINQIFKNTMHSKHVYLFEDKTHISQMVILEAVFEQAPLSLRIICTLHDWYTSTRV